MRQRTTATIGATASCGTPIIQTMAQTTKDTAITVGKIRQTRFIIALTLMIRLLR